MKVTFTQKFAWSPHGYDYEEFQAGETADVPELCYEIAKSIGIIKEGKKDESDSDRNNASKPGGGKAAAKHSKRG